MDVRDRVKEMRLVPADQLTANPSNWRRHPQAQQRALSAVLDEVGFAGAVIAREDDDGHLIIIDGHARAEMVGKATVPVLVTDLTEAEADVVLATYDPIGAMAQKDHEAFTALAARIDTANETLLGLLGRTKDGETDPDDVPDVPEEAQSERGEVYELGPHRVMCGDCFDLDQLRQAVEDGTAGMALTDPPYAIFGSSTGISSEISDDKMVRPFFADLGFALRRATKPFAHVYVHCDWRSYQVVWYGMTNAGLVPKNCIVWDKGDGGLGAMYMNSHEFVTFFVNEPSTGAATGHGKKAGQRTVNDQTNIYRAGRVTGDDRQHNAAKPLGMLMWLIQNSTDEGEVVCDPFLGSGTTLIAAEQTGRVCYGMEIEPKYVDVIRQRYADFVGDPRLAPNG